MKKKKIIKIIKNIDKKMDDVFGEFVLALITLIVRFPSLVEPYWHEDEGIYLTIGHALRDGKLLYKQIFDHKTPLIYYLSMLGSQLKMRIAAIVFVIIATIVLYRLLLRLRIKKRLAYISSVIYIILSSTPFFQGNVSNAEIFMNTCTLLAVFLFVKSKIFEKLTEKKLKFIKATNKKKSFRSLLNNLIKDHNFYAGICFSLAFLFKAPALLEFMAFMMSYLYLISKHSYQYYKSKKQLLKKDVFKIVKNYLILYCNLIMGFILPILIFLAYYFFRSNLIEFIDSAFLYNFKYVSLYKIETNLLNQIIFSRIGKLLVVLLAMISTVVLSIKTNPKNVILSLWFLMSLLAASLSNRPYHHYLIEVMPALIVLSTFVIAHLKKIKMIIFLSIILLTFNYVRLTLNIRLESHIDYYDNFLSLMTKNIDLNQYRDYFLSQASDNYQINGYINNDKSDDLIIWGENANLYALARKYPPLKYVTNRHMKQNQEVEEVVDQIYKNPPKYLIIMNNSDNKDLSYLVSTEYMLLETFDNFVFYKRIRL